MNDQSISNHLGNILPTLVPSTLSYWPLQRIFNSANIDVERYAVGFSAGENIMRLFRILIHAPESHKPVYN